jgi:hypothetical protein
MDNIDGLLSKLGACKAAREFAEGKSFEEIYKTCHRGDWLLWLFKKTMDDTEVDLRKLTRVKALCALTVRHLMKDERSIKACEISLLFSEGKATRIELNDAYAAAYAAATDAYAYATYAAATAADAAAAAAYAAATAVDTAAADAADAADADAYADAYVAAAADAARIKNQKKTADIFREHISIKDFNLPT